MFTELSWFFVMDGMGLRPEHYDPLVDATDFEQVKQVMAGMKQQIAAQVAAAPTHDSFYPDKPRDTTPARGWTVRTANST